MKKFIKSLGLVLIFTFFTSTGVMAKSDDAKESLLALGDSIPYGFNLGETNETSSKYAFPYLIGESADLRVRNLAVPGWKTDQLVTALEHQKYRQAIKHADYITLNIGNNDLLQAWAAAATLSAGDPFKFQSYLTEQINTSKLFANLGNIIAENRSLTDAPIVIYNVYNPFQRNNPLHSIALTALPGINQQLSLFIASLGYDNLLIADAFSAFDQNQAAYVINGDIHPTVAGQKKLAEIGLETLGLE